VIKLSISSGDREEILEASGGENLLELLRASGFFMDAPCGGKGACGKCGVRIDGKWRLACRTSTEADAAITIPSGPSYFAAEAGNGMDDVRAVLDGGRLTGVRAGDLGVAMDLGTTTVSLSLLDLSAASLLDSVSFYNPQIMYGADVINRIIFSLRGEGRAILQNAILRETERAILHLCGRRGVQPARIRTMVVAGNTTMQHLFLGLDARYIREEPFEPFSRVFPVHPAADLLPALKSAELHLLPCVANYLGADMVAGTAACGMHKANGVSMLLDIGTNGEIMVGNRDWLMGCACSAGPAFEGMGLSCGMRYREGAVTDVEVRGGRLEFTVAGGGSPEGICGAGAIGLIAGLKELGLIDERGRFTEKVTGTVGSRKAFVLHESVSVDEPDIDNIIRAKAAIFAGLRTMLRTLSLGLGDIERLHISGGMGSSLVLEKAVKLGLLPPLAAERVIPSGNTSLKGTILYLLSDRFREETAAVQRMTTYVDLGREPAFMDEFMAALFIPHTDRGLFQ
jgi:uncharacterized 2Fe-2S/4Fe-4S cluster protein (DUF4445 family)